ncbi:hypothetical protein D3C76_1595580 [compost metagenome]
MKLSDYRFQLSEISGLYWIDFQEFEELINGNRNGVQAEGVIVNEIDGKIEPHIKICGREDFTPKSEQYYALLFSKIKELL